MFRQGRRCSACRRGKRNDAVKMQRTTLGVTSALAVLLLAAVVFQSLYRLREVPQPKARVRLVAALPAESPHWTIADEPLGQTEIINEAVLKTLNLDDY